MNDVKTTEIPVFASGEQVAVGSRIRLADGRLVRVRALILTEEGCLVSSKALAADGKGIFAVDPIVASAEEDSREALDADSELSVSEYIKRRALDVDGLTQAEKISAMISDIRRRERNLCHA